MIPRLAIDLTCVVSGKLLNFRAWEIRKDNIEKWSLNWDLISRKHHQNKELVEANHCWRETAYTKYLWWKEAINHERIKEIGLIDVTEVTREPEVKGNMKNVTYHKANGEPVKELEWSCLHLRKNLWL